MSARRFSTAILTGVALVSLFACASTKSNQGVAEPVPEAWSLSGEPLFALPLKPEDRAKKEAQLAAAREALAENPGGADELIWVGRRLAYLSRFNEAIEVFTQGIAEHPEDARFYRHRGHRYITVRRFDLAVPDLQRAAKLVEGRLDQIEPAGLPNARGITLDTLNQNIYYHLGLAHYLRGDFDQADDAFQRCVTFSKNDDSLCSATHWLYMTLRRLGRDAEAREALQPIRGDFDIVEYKSYHELCLMYQGALDPDRLLAEVSGEERSTADFATLAYGIGNWHLYNGRKERAFEVFRQAATAEIWPAFGRIAAEVELAREAEADLPAARPSSPTP